jgi:hypothetical protein
LDTSKLIPLLDNLPESVKEAATELVARMGTAIEGIGDDGIEWRPPFLRLVQGTTDRSSIPKGTAIGDFVLGEINVSRPLKFIPLRLWTGRQYWNPDQTKSNVLCFSPDDKVGTFGDSCKTCPYSQWVESEGSACGKYIGLLALSADLSQVFTVNFAKSSYAAGMELQSAMKKAGVDAYRRMYGLTSVTSTKAKNVETFKIEALPDKERPTPAELLPFVKALFDIAAADRKAQVETFYLEVDRKKAAGLFLPKPEVAEAQTPALGAPASDAPASPMAKSYTM